MKKYKPIKKPPINLTIIQVSLIVIFGSIFSVNIKELQSMWLMWWCAVFIVFALIEKGQIKIGEKK